MEEKELILKLQSLKQIKPRENWVVFSKSQILNADINQVASKSFYEKVFSTFSSLTSQRKLSYAFAALLFMVTGFVGFNFSGLDFANNSPAALVSSNNDIEMFKVTSHNLAEAVKSNSEDITVEVTEVKVAALNLKEAIVKDPKLAKEVALELKNSGTLASLDGGAELKEASSDLYKTIDIQMIDDLQETTLTVDQQVIFEQAKKLFNDGKYFEALEKILLINN